MLDGPTRRTTASGPGASDQGAAPLDRPAPGGLVAEKLLSRARRPVDGATRAARRLWSGAAEGARGARAELARARASGDWRRGRYWLGAAAAAGLALRDALAHMSFSTLTGRIVALNMVGLAVLVLGALVLDQYRDGLIDQRHRSLQTEAELIALAIVEAAGNQERMIDDAIIGEIPAPTYDRIVANEALRRLTLPIGMRAQIFDATGRVTGDTRLLHGGRDVVEIDQTGGVGGADGFFARLERLFERMLRLIRPSLEIYEEFLPRDMGITRAPEVYEALEGRVGKARRVNSENELILSVAVPITRVKGVMGALALSTEGGVIEEVVKEARVAILQVFAIAVGATLLVSFLLAQTIARPIRRLAAAAERGTRRAGARGELDPADATAEAEEAGAERRVALPDLTDRTDEIGELSGALRRMTDALYDRMEAIGAFAADVAHEIKNPLTSLRSAVESLRLARTDAQREQLLAVIEHDVRRMDRLVTDISNASRLDAELVRERKQAFDLRTLLEGVAAIAAPAAEERGVRVRVAAGAEEPVVLQGIETRLAQVFHNLIDNALSFSPEGGEIEIRVAPERLGRRAGWRVEVLDQGPGVPAENLESIFERFYSSRPGEEAFGQHSGLGLSICRQIVEAHGGRIWAEARDDGPGARFVTVLPA